MYKLGEKIAELRKVKGLTQSELAEELEVTSQAVSKWEVGSSYPDITILPKLTRILETSADYLLNEGYEPDIRYIKEENRKNIDELVFKIRIQDDGDSVKINLPIPFLKLGVQLGDGLNINGNNIGKILENVDINKLIEMAEKGILGKFVEIEGKDGEQVSIFIE